MNKKMSKQAAPQLLNRFIKAVKAGGSTPEKAIRWLYKEAINGNVTAARIIFALRN